MEGRDKVGMKDFDLLKVLGTGGKWIWFQITTGLRLILAKYEVPILTIS